MKNKLLTLLLCVLFIAGAIIPSAFAAGGVNVEIDIGGLYPGGSNDNGDNDNTENPGDTEDTDNGNVDADKEDNNNKEDNDDQDVPVKDDNKNDNDDDDIPGPPDPPTDNNDYGTGPLDPSTDNNDSAVDTGSDTKTETTDPEKPEEKPVVIPDFYDVKEDDWFYNDVRELAGMKIIDGYTDGSFQPEGDVTRAEFLKMIVSLVCAESFTTDGKMFEDVEPDAWYATYIATAYVFGFIDTNDYGGRFEPDKAITRREASKIMARALSAVVGGVNIEALYGKYKSPYADTSDYNITALYGLCIMQGSIDPISGERCFYPDSNITRAETATVMLRIHKLMRDSNAYIIEFKKTYNNPELQILYAPQSADAFYEDIRNAWDHSQAFLSYTYPYAPQSEQMARISEACYVGFTLAGEHHPELGTHVAVQMSALPAAGGCTLTLSFCSQNENESYQQLSEKRDTAKQRAALLAPAITQECLTPFEKADVIHDYLLQNLAYDNTPDADAYTAYGAFENKEAVCQGYSSAFNLLCRAVGVQALAIANPTHMWNVVLSNGELRHYDVTFDDAEGASPDTYRGILHADFRPDTAHEGFSLPHTALFSL